MEIDLREVPKDRGRKRKIQIIFCIFIILLVLFTLFSNTFQSLTLPKVRTENAVYGSLVHTLEGNGILQPIAEAKLVNSDHWKVATILVKEGDHVKKGQKLITYDSKSAERELQDEITHLEKQKIELQNIQDRFITSTTEGDEMGIRTAKRDIETYKLDLGVQERKINVLRDRIDNQKEISAPFDGVITKLNAIEGMVSAEEPDVLVSNSSLGYRLDIFADSTLLSSLGISIGEKIEVEVGTAQEQQTRMIVGTIEEMENERPRTNEEAGKTITIPQKVLRIKVVNSQLIGGEQARIKLEKRSSREGFVISNVAIHEERDGMFVYKVEEQRGALGNVFIARKVLIHYSETMDKETMIQSDNVYDDDLIILESSEPLQDGNRIRME
ncbi:multidrug efflux pump subunit AcrA (membrane-fusion protein) [Paenibacillus anaericanus]|uniref:efflux RND transporter periplasmic adaptor subunit n=1 Tax=Paenibacillus anaericanus TaxID=170367 RepID=UPI00277D3E5E|nr:biotin/lipoyl-binding protein [Paenibacillus anaericanus]MDQ0088745.1 multidrug efflux pump subunit AcrA (membrane-fusion protein) [Paenibacillus anaericanus]